MRLFRDMYRDSRFSDLDPEMLYDPDFQAGVRRLPLNFFIVRHGYSWGNFATHFLKENRLRDMPREIFEFVTTHPGFEYPLTDFPVDDMPPGIEQAYSVSAWFADQFPFPIHRAYFSTHERAAQSMYLGLQGLGVPTRRWYRDTQQGERNWGIFDMFNPDPEIVAQYLELRKTLDLDPLHATPHLGENLVSVLQRSTGSMLPRLYRKCTDMNVVCFCHGEVAWCYRYKLEGMTPAFYHSLHESKSEIASHKIHNSQVLWYTRLDPFTGKEHEHFAWVKFVVPWAQQFNADWQSVNPGQHMEDEFARLQQSTPIPKRQLYVPA